MNTFTAFFWKEWHSQRAMLLAFVGMAFTAVALVFLFASPTWLTDPRIASTVVGMAGVLFVVVPQTVLCEFSNKDDQFLRRLPGALPVAFAAKLMFVLLAALAFPWVGRLLGEALVAKQVRDEFAVFVAKDLAQIVPGYVVALPLVLAFAFMLPGARMAVGAAAVFALGLGAAVFGVVRSCPGIDAVLASPVHVPVFAAVAVATAFVGCVFGRRGGNHWRSAKLGAATLALGLLPHAVWLGTAVQHYRHSDPAALAFVETLGVSPDAMTALVVGSENADGRYGGYGCVFRLDLTSGAMEQLTVPPSAAIATDFLRPVQWTASPRRRFWMLWDHPEGVAYDLVTGARWPLHVDQHAHRALPPPSLLPSLAAERRVSAVRLPDGCLAWLEGDAVHFEERDGSVSSMPWSHGNDGWHAVGHGIATTSAARPPEYFDLVHRRFVALPNKNFLGLVDIAGTRLSQNHKDGWLWIDGATDAQRLAPGMTADDAVLDLLDDRSALVVRHRQQLRLYAFRPATGELLPIALPTLPPDRCEESCPRPLPEVVRDPSGRRWLLLTSRAAVWRSALLAVDPQTLAGRVMMTSNEEHLDVIAFDSDHTVLVDESHHRLVRLDTTTGERTVLLPRH